MPIKNPIMVIPTRKFILKPRPFLSRLFLSTSFSSSSSSSSQVLTNPPLIGHQLQNLLTDSKEIASSFRDWFRTSKNPTFDKIYQVLSTKSDEDLASFSTIGSDCGLRLSESLVLEALNYKKDDVLSCLKFFDWAGRQPYFHHTRATCIALFKILGGAKLTSLMLELLDTFDKQRYLHRVRPNHILVIGYSLAGKIDTALQVFGRMRYQGLDLDEVSYHILLNSVVEQGHFDAMEVVLEQIKCRGHVSDVTHGIVMKSFCKQGQLEEAEKYLRSLLDDGKELPKYSLGYLVDALCRENKFSHASMLIEEFGEMGVLPVQEAYGVWIKNLVQAGNLDSAMEFFKDKKSGEGYIPEVFRYNVLICRLLKENRLDEVCDLLLDMKESHVVPDKVTMNAVLCFFCKAGMMDVAMELYELKTEFGLTPHSLVFNYVINTLCGDGGSDQAYQMLKTSMKLGYFPGQRTFTILADALCREGKLDKVKDLIMFALEGKFTAVKCTIEKFIRALCRANRVEDGYLLHGEFNRLNETPSESTYSYLICGFNKVSRGDVAARLLFEMQEKGLEPPKKLFIAVVRCVCEMDNSEKHFLRLLEMQRTRYGINQRTLCYFIHGAMKAKRPELGRGVYDMLLRTGVVPLLCSDLLMLKCYLESRKVAEAVNFFDDVISRRKVGSKMLNTMVVGLSKLQKEDLASAILKQGRNMGMVPSLCCYEELIKLCCVEKKFDNAVKLINDLEKVGRNVSTFIGNVLLLHSLHCRELHKAWLRSRDQSAENTPSGAMLGQLIAVFSGHMTFDAKAEDLEEVIQRCFPLDIYTYNMMLRKLCINKIDEVFNLFKLLCQKGHKPNRWTYEIIVNGLYKHGRIAEAEVWTDEMLRQGFVPTECTHVYS